MSKIKVCAYCRVSTDAENQRNSYEAQVEYFHRELSSDERFDLVSIYADRGISGTKLQREQFDMMLLDAGLDIKQVVNDAGDTRKNMVKYVTIPSATRKPKFKYIYVKDASRFARNVRVLDIIDDLRQNKVYVKFLDFDLCTEREDDIGRIRMFFDNAEWESRLKSKKVRWGFDESIKKNLVIHTNSKLYGYAYIKEENRLQILPDEAEIVRQIFSLYADGVGVRRISNMLEEQGTFTRQGKKFCKNSIMRILGNEKYIGLNNRGKHDTGIIFISKNSYPKVKEKYIKEPNSKIPVIIESEIFEKCQEILHSKVNYENSKGIYKGTSTYHNLLYCGRCGSVYHSNHYVDKRKKKQITYDYYICSKRKGQGKKACDSVIVKKADIDDLIERMMLQGISSLVRQYWERTMKKLTIFKYYLMAKVADNDTVKVQKINAEITDLNSKKAKLLDVYINDNLTDKKIFIESINAIDKQLQEKQSIINELTKNPKEIIALVERTKANLEELKDYEFEIKDSYSKDEVLDIVDRIFVEGDEVSSVALSIGSMKIFNEYVQLFDYNNAETFRILNSDESLKKATDKDQLQSWALLETKYNKVASLYII